MPRRVVLGDAWRAKRAFGSLFPATRMRSRSGGFTLVELAVVLVISATLMLAGLRLLQLTSASGQVEAAQAEAKAGHDAVVAFALANRRLPCPDLTGNGLEGDCGNGAREGWLPVVSLEMSDRSGTAMLEMRPRYAVFRSAAADLVRPDAAAAADAEQAFVRALKVVALQPFDASQPYTALTPDACARGQANAAFALRVPLDSENRDLTHGTMCFPLTDSISSEPAAGLLAIFSKKG
ncbi:prepilin-type N-terminal cleavage/methylation domain-containing protein [Pseudacidovorax intermedius]|uniref:Prepilin-type N-terminal cleavage/methylation domain-containing protein n=1 Tax=Pseudacidovorax intermedius TaxID=433924 RepID=A0A370F9V8_9BURK|nr:type II secretion system protein [Pseudacidovorax intermedius]RDI21889.1 prepilin-type N-terminal cleavage/methylation domain-containing protein [Pseudacidovorax intermedius]